MVDTAARSFLCFAHRVEARRSGACRLVASMRFSTRAFARTKSVRLGVPLPSAQEPTSSYRQL
jgi:hypothetical protein